MIKRFSKAQLMLFTTVNLLLLVWLSEYFKGSSPPNLHELAQNAVNDQGISYQFIQGVECKNDPACSENCPICCQLPVNKDTGKLEVHHYLTGQGLWNEEKRFEGINLSAGNTIMYAGGNTDGADGIKFMKLCPQCTLHIYEPVPQFYTNLETVWSHHSLTNQWKVTVHNYGLGDSNRTVLLTQADLRGQGTFGMKDTEEEEEEQKIPLDIIEASVVVRNVTAGAGVEALDLLHVNCEGCEYEMLENIIKSNLHTKIRMIQFGSHYFSSVPQLTRRFCSIRETLSLSHHMVYGQAFSWERWERKMD